MDYCLVLQNDETGKQRGLCWAATCATMIRYSTGNRSNESFQIANEMGIGENKVYKHKKNALSTLAKRMKADEL